MKIIKSHPVKYEGSQTFKGIPEEEYFKEITKLDDKIRKETFQNQIAEQKSKEVSKTYIVGTGILKSEHTPAKPAVEKVWDCTSILEVARETDENNAEEYVHQVKSGKRKFNHPIRYFVNEHSDEQDASQKFLDWLHSPQAEKIIDEIKSSRIPSQLPPTLNK